MSGRRRTFFVAQATANIAAGATATITIDLSSEEDVALGHVAAADASGSTTDLLVESLGTLSLHGGLELGVLGEGASSPNEVSLREVFGANASIGGSLPVVVTNNGAAARDVTVQVSGVSG